MEAEKPLLAQENNSLWFSFVRGEILEVSEAEILENNHNLTDRINLLIQQGVINSKMGENGHGSERFLFYPKRLHQKHGSDRD